jgi:hypothetical protein
MMETLNYLSLHPEIKKYTLTNLYTNEETLVTKEQLLAAFGEEGFLKIKSGRNDAWLLSDYYD